MIELIKRLHIKINRRQSLTRQGRAVWWAEKTGVQPMRQFDNTYEKGRKKA